MRQIDHQPAGQSAEPTTAVNDARGVIETVFNILDRWGADPAEQQAVLGISPRTYYAWRRNPPRRVDPDKLERLSYLLGIWKGLRQLFPTNKAYEKWPRLPNSAPVFAGATPMAVMTAGHVADLYRVRSWIDGWRGWN